MDVTAVQKFNPINGFQELLDENFQGRLGEVKTAVFKLVVAFM